MIKIKLYTTVANGKRKRGTFLDESAIKCTLVEFLSVHFDQYEFHITSTIKPRGVMRIVQVKKEEREVLQAV